MAFSCIRESPDFFILLKARSVRHNLGIISATDQRLRSKLYESQGTSNYTYNKNIALLIIS